MAGSESALMGEPRPRVMESFISLGLKQGAHIIAASFYRGGEVIAADLTAAQRQAYYDAGNQTVDLINGDFHKYAHHIAAGRLTRRTIARRRCGRCRYLSPRESSLTPISAS